MTKYLKYVLLFQTFLLSIFPVGLIIGTGASEAVIILICIIFLFHTSIDKYFKFLKKKEFYLLLIIWFYLILNFILAKDSGLSAYRSIFFFKYILFIFAIEKIFDNKNNIKFVFMAWLAALLIVSIDIFYEFTFKENIFGYKSLDETRIVSFMRDELRIGHLVLGFFLLCCGYISYEHKKLTLTKNVLSSLFLILFFLSIIITGERANSLRALVGIFLFIILIKSKLRLLLLILVICLPVSIFFLSKNIKDRYDSVYYNLNLNLNTNDNFLTNTLHGAHYNTAWEIFKNYPIFGVGNKNYRIECGENKYFNENYKHSKSRCNTHPHQIYLELLSELGIIGAVLIFGFLFYVIFRSAQSFIINKNYILLGSIIYLITYLIPLIPTGSFFSSFNASIFWLNLSIMLKFKNNA